MDSARGRQKPHRPSNTVTLFVSKIASTPTSLFGFLTSYQGPRSQQRCSYQRALKIVMSKGKEEEGSQLRRSARKKSGGGSSGTEEVDSESALKSPTRSSKTKQQQGEAAPLDAEESRQKVAGGKNVTFRNSDREQTGLPETNPQSRSAISCGRLCGRMLC